ncbi:putative DNA-binding domain-containing protein [Shewanella sp. Isolate11]|uniref:HvfC family RiPP maturation protein n=1 Tax=Shewanella sp. Isolate11 TaxID=2908530 RepID=UPI001EFE44A9|nr:putative DNA-binding domain-containing protein [Shewanella sp. Isolate11]MCG9696876.1 putative DNA-binding domain-containing protein [Shewanella sp. Isolate11]
MDFVEVQQSFIDHIRDPQQPLPIGTDERRMKVYRELFFNNIKGFVSNGFPVLCSLYSEERWQALIQQFFVQHDCKTPIFIEIAQEFISFLQHEYQAKADDPSFMLELAHYEWLELLVATAFDNPSYQRVDNIESDKLVLSNSAKVAQYHYPVQKISSDYRPITPDEQPSLFCIYRDAEDEVCFLQLNPLAAQVLAYIELQEAISFDDICQWLRDTYSEMDAQMLVSGCRQMLQQMADKEIVLSSQR